MIHLPMLGDLMDAIKPGLSDDSADRLNFFVTPLILIFFTFCEMGKQYVGKPIICHNPAETPGLWNQYIEDYCFVTNTWFYPFNGSSIPVENDRENREIGYYQWIPITLALQALFCYAPYYLWRSFAESGIHLDSVMVKSRQILLSQDQKEDVRELGVYLVHNIYASRFHSPAHWLICLRFPNPLRGSAVSISYLLFKLANCANIFFQFYLLNLFMGHGTSVWGWDVVSSILHGRTWEETGFFPRTTLCDYYIRTVGNLQRLTTQCVLMMNMFNEKMFVFLWIWFLVVGVITVLNCVYWVYLTLSTPSRLSTVERYLRIGGALSDSGEGWRRDAGEVRCFAEHWVMRDGLLVLRFLAAHQGEIMATQLTLHLWQEFQVPASSPPSPSIEEEVQAKHDPWSMCEGCRRRGGERTVVYASSLADSEGKKLPEDAGFVEYETGADARYPHPLPFHRRPTISSPIPTKLPLV